MVFLCVALCGGPALANIEGGPEILEPLIVERPRGLLDSNAAIYRQRLPCAGTCEDGAPEQRLIERVLDDLRRQMRASQLPQRPKFYEARAILAPSLYRYDDKLP